MQNLQRDSPTDKHTKLLVSSGLHFLHTLGAVFPLLLTNSLPVLHGLLEVSLRQLTRLCIYPWGTSPCAAF